MPFDIVAFDADDTLWHSEDGFERVCQRFVEAVAPYAPEGADCFRHLMSVERRNFPVYGYGAKAFSLSMVEAAIELTGGSIPTTVLQGLMDEGRSLITRPVELLDGVVETLERLARAFRLVVITKGDLLHQHQKVATSGIDHLFEHVEVVNEKDPGTYRTILRRLDATTERFAMVGNSVKSDVIPVLNIGGSAAHVPYHLLWEGEHVDDDHGHEFETLDSIGEVPDWIDRQRRRRRTESTR
jgi:putative hydrolase of the HAD superfamily